MCVCVCIHWKIGEDKFFLFKLQITRLEGTRSFESAFDCKRRNHSKRSANVYTNARIRTSLSPALERPSDGASLIRRLLLWALTHKRIRFCRRDAHLKCHYHKFVGGVHFKCEYWTVCTAAENILFEELAIKLNTWWFALKFNLCIFSRCCGHCNMNFGNAQHFYCVRKSSVYCCAVCSSCSANSLPANDEWHARHHECWIRVYVWARKLYLVCY